MMNLTLVMLLACAAPPDVPTRQATGALVDAAGRPIAGAEVIVSSEPDFKRCVACCGSGRTIPNRPCAATNQRWQSPGKPTRPVASRFPCRPTSPPAASPIRWCCGSSRMTNCGPSGGCRGWRCRSTGRWQSTRPVRCAAVVEITTPEGDPLGEASVAPAIVSGQELPRELAGRFAVHCDTRGRATLAGISLDVVDEIAVESPRFGQQRIRVQKSAAPAIATARLAPVGSLAGRLAADVELSGLRIVAVSEAGGYADSGARGSASAVCDRDGHFDFGPIVAGLVALDINWQSRPDLAIRVFPPLNLVVEPNERAQPTIELGAAVRLIGVIQEKNGGAKVGGVQLTVSGFDRTATSAADGTFRGCLQADMDYAYAFPRTLPLPLVLARADDIGKDRGPGAEEVRFEPIEVIRGRRLAGQRRRRTGRRHGRLGRGPLEQHRGLQRDLVCPQRSPGPFRARRRASRRHDPGQSPQP